MENVENKDTVVDTQVESGAGATVEKNLEEIFTKLDEIRGKREDGISKSILREHGVEDDDLKDILNAYKQRNANKAKAVENEIAELKRANAELIQQIKTGEKSAAIGKAAAELGIAAENVLYVEKLADLSNIEVDGHVDMEKVKAALQTVLEAVPAFKPATKTEPENGFVKVGGKKTEQSKDDLEVNRIRKRMGLPEMKK